MIFSTEKMKEPEQPAWIWRIWKWALSVFIPAGFELQMWLLCCHGEQWWVDELMLKSSSSWGQCIPKRECDPNKLLEQMREIFQSRDMGWKIGGVRLRERAALVAGCRHAFLPSLRQSANQEGTRKQCLLLEQNMFQHLSHAMPLKNVSFFALCYGEHHVDI